jgi:zinc protease
MTTFLQSLRRSGSRCVAGVARTVVALFLLCTSATAWTMLPIQTWSAPSGARVYFVENRDLPMIDVGVDFPAGSGYDTPERSGTASLVQHLLRLGARGMNENEISRRIADVGAHLGGRFDFDRAGMSLRTLSSARERDETLAVLARVLQAPEFPESVIVREKARIVSGLKDADTKPETVASRTFNRLVYRDHPYALRGSGEVDTLARIGREDLVRFYRTHYLAGRAVVAIMGDVSREEAERIADLLTRDLPRGEGAGPQIPEVPLLDAPVSRTIPHPSAQSHILVGAPAIGRGHPDFFPVFVGNYVLGGGGFASRLNEEVRQKRGLAYSVYSTFSALQRRGAFQVGLQTLGEQSGEALAVVRDVLRDFLRNGPTEDELAAAKGNIIGGFPLRIDSNRKIHEYLGLIGFYQLPLTYLQDFVPSIEKVTAAEVKAAFARHVRPETLVTVVVGGQGAAAAAGK